MCVGLTVVGVVWAGAAAAGSTAPEANDPLRDTAYRLGAGAWERLVPDEVRRHYRYPNVEQWNLFWGMVQETLGSGTVEDLADLRPYVRDAVEFMKLAPPLEPYAAWLHARLDYFDAAELVMRSRQPKRQAVDRTPWTRMAARPKSVPAPLPRAIREEKFWDRQAERRKPSPRAAELVPQLKTAFEAEAVPPSLVWLAEVESSMRPDARSPVGAVGLFQLMPATAERFGLSLAPRDERTDPEKSARAAAKYLAILRRRFDSWPLALAAYNAGEGRVGRVLEREKAKTFDEIADALPSETQLYVPKVLATIHAREGVELR